MDFYNTNVFAWQTLRKDPDRDSSGVEDALEDLEAEDDWNEVSFVMGNHGEEGGSGVQASIEH